LVLDTNIIVAGLRSPAGASAALLDQALLRKFTPLLTVALALEYEAVCMEPEQRLMSGLSSGEVKAIITAICAVAEAAETHFLWRPQLHDAGDEMVLEAAVNGRADALVTFNQRDFGSVPARFGIDMIGPQEALRRLAQ
jgi:putative PIN family toxin of toxin-antitoxin system